MKLNIERLKYVRGLYSHFYSSLAETRCFQNLNFDTIQNSSCYLWSQCSLWMASVTTTKKGERGRRRREKERGRRERSRDFLPLKYNSLTWFWFCLSLRTFTELSTPLSENFSLCVNVTWITENRWILSSFLSPSFFLFLPPPPIISIKIFPFSS